MVREGLWPKTPATYWGFGGRAAQRRRWDPPSPHPRTRCSIVAKPVAEPVTADDTAPAKCPAPHLSTAYMYAQNSKHDEGRGAQVRKNANVEAVKL